MARSLFISMLGVWVLGGQSSVCRGVLLSGGALCVQLSACYSFRLRMFLLCRSVADPDSTCCVMYLKHGHAQQGWCRYVIVCGVFYLCGSEY